MTQMNSSFGSSGMTMAFNELQFSCFIQYLKDGAEAPLPIKKAACVVGVPP